MALQIFAGHNLSIPEHFVMDRRLLTFGWPRQVGG